VEGSGIFSPEKLCQYSTCWSATRDIRRGRKYQVKTGEIRMLKMMRNAGTG
jgi:hypothetical protein